ncbi:calmodulin [Reticulomyxa filosa]|uniref:Calmodulin n=1 Tax=Reticulomyxa filosa TaxID=46433 RepID=X6MW54_RETFI|nr:calmodulin [Reticulomyxa filosa]|eukprot:ETO17697.1 calmodulin [Reticulomyxa filosa]
MSLSNENTQEPKEEINASGQTKSEDVITKASEEKPKRKTGRRKSQLDANEVRELREAFAYFDQNNDGEITTQEIGKVMTKIGLDVNEEELRDIMNDLDTNGDGHMDFDEFVGMMDRRMSIGSQIDEMKLTFSVFDRNGDGKIDFEELKEVLSCLGEEISDKDIKDMIQEADTNGDGYIDFEEFVKMMSANEDDNTKLSLLLKA